MGLSIPAGDNKYPKIMKSVHDPTINSGNLLILVLKENNTAAMYGIQTTKPKGVMRSVINIAMVRKITERGKSQFGLFVFITKSICDIIN
jgi:hypothetical protein